jgi:hypothetical protein
MESAPDELAVELVIFPFDLRLFKVTVVVAIVCWSGADDEGARMIKPLRSYSIPIFNSVRPVPYAHLTDLGDKVPPPNQFWRGGSLDTLSDGAIDELAHAARNAPPGWSIGLGHYMHGQITRVDDAATPLLRRHGQLTYFLSATWPDSHRGDAGMEWVRASMSAMCPWQSQRTYVNYLCTNSEAAVRAAYADNYKRLRMLKRKYDPTNVFHYNRNIDPDGR